MISRAIAQGVTGTATSVREYGSRYIHWWTTELLALVPRRWRALMAHATRRLVVDVDGDQAHVALHNGHGVQKLASFAFGTDAADQPKAWAIISGACGERIEEVIVRLPARQVLRHTLSFPLAAEENLREVLAYEMDRHTPFKAEQVYYDFAIVERAPAERSVRVELTLIPRASIDPLLKILAVRGLEVTALTLAPVSTSAGVPTDAETSDAGINLLPTARARSSRGSHDRHNRVLLGLAAVLLLLAVIVPLAQQRSMVSELGAKVQAVREKALEAEQTRKELEQLMAATTALVAERNARPLVIGILDEVTRILPDSTWLTRLEINGSKVKIQGESSNASEVATLMLGSAMFPDARFESPVTRNPRTANERFVISANIKRLTSQ